MISRVKICQVGCGYWGVNIARNLAALENVELALCDQDSDRLVRTATRHHVASTYGNFKDALADASIDAFVLVTPAGQHYAQALAVLEAGKHVLVEKPLAHSTAEAHELAQLADRKKCIAMVGHTFLYNNIVHRVKSYLESGELGNVLYAYSQRLNLGLFRRDTDVLWTLAPHDVSILNYWFGDRPERVSARGQTYIHRPGGPSEVCFAHLEYPGGRHAHLHLSWLDPQKRREMVIVGSRKMLVYDDVNADAHIRIYDRSAEAQHHRENADFAEFTTKLRAGDLVIPNVRLTEPLAVELQHFADAIQNGTRPRTDAWHGLDVVAALEALGHSMAQDGDPVTVKYPQQGICK